MTLATTIFLDPDGTHDIGHYVLVLRRTGVRYETQCGGVTTVHREFRLARTTTNPTGAR